MWNGIEKEKKEVNAERERNEKVMEEKAEETKERRVRKVEKRHR